MAKSPGDSGSGKTPTGKKAPSGKNTSGRGQRDLKVKVKTARGPDQLLYPLAFAPVE